MKALFLLLFPLLSFAQYKLKPIEPKEMYEGKMLSVQMNFDTQVDSLRISWSLVGDTLPSMKISSEGVFSWTPSYKTVAKGEQFKNYAFYVLSIANKDTLRFRDSVLVAVTVFNANSAPKIPNEPEIFWISKANVEVSKTFEPQYYRDEEGDELAFRLMNNRYSNIQLSPNGILKVLVNTKDLKALPDTLYFEVFELNTDENLSTRQKIILQRAETDEAPVISFFPATEKFIIEEGDNLKLEILVSDENNDIKTIDFYTNPQGKMNPKDFVQKTVHGYLFDWMPNLEFVNKEATSKSFFLLVQATDESKLTTTQKVEVEVLNKIDWSIEDSIRTNDYHTYLTQAYTYLMHFEPQLEQMAKEFKRKHKNKELLASFTKVLGEVKNVQFKKDSVLYDKHIIGNTESVANATQILMQEPDYVPIQTLLKLIPKLHLEASLFATKFKRIADRRTVEFMQAQEQFIATLTEARYGIDEKNNKPKKIEVSPALIQQRFGAY